MIWSNLLYEQDIPSDAPKPTSERKEGRFDKVLEEAALLKLEVLLRTYVSGATLTGTGYEQQQQEADMRTQIQLLQEYVLHNVFGVDQWDGGLRYDEMLLLLELHRIHGEKLVQVITILQHHKRSFFSVGPDADQKWCYAFLDKYSVQDIDTLAKQINITYKGLHNEGDSLLLAQECAEGIDCFAALCNYAYEQGGGDPMGYVLKVVDGLRLCESQGVFERAIDNYSARWFEGEYNIHRVFADAYWIGSQDQLFAALVISYYTRAIKRDVVPTGADIVDLIQEAQRYKLDTAFFETLHEGYAMLSDHINMPLLDHKDLLRRAQSFVAHKDSIQRIDQACVDLDIYLEIDHGYLYRLFPDKTERLIQLMRLCKQVDYKYIKYSDIGDWFYPTSRPMSEVDGLRARDEDKTLLPKLTEFAKQYDMRIAQGTLDKYYTAGHWFADLEMLYNSGMKNATSPDQFKQRLQLFGNTPNKYKMYKERFIDNPLAVSLFNYIQDRKAPVVLTNLGGRVLQSITLSTQPASMHRLRGITEMMISIGIKAPNQNDDIGRDEIFAQYQGVLQTKIAKDVTRQSDGIVVPKGKQTFKKIFFCGATNGRYEDGSKPEDDNDAFAKVNELKESLQRFTGDFEDFSSQVGSEGYIAHPYDVDAFVQAIDDYTKAHPDDDICVYLAFHGGKDGTIGRFDKQTVNALARKSPHVLLATDSCHFGYSMVDPYGREATQARKDTGAIRGPVSGGSGQHWGYANYMHVFHDIIKANHEVGFHEAELLIRTKYFESFAPLYDIQAVPNPNHGGKSKQIPVGITQVENEEVPDWTVRI